MIQSINQENCKLLSYLLYTFVIYAGSEIIVEDDEWGVQNYTLKLLHGSDSFFIVGNTLVPNNEFDYERHGEKQWKIKIKATDNGDPPLSVSILHILDVRIKVGRWLQGLGIYNKFGFCNLQVTSDIVVGLLDQNEEPYDLTVANSNGQLHFRKNQPRIKENSLPGTLFSNLFG